MLTKEEIRNKWIYHAPLKPLPECVDSAMDEYAAVWKEKAEGLAKVLRALRTSLCAQQNSFEEDNSEYGILQDNLNDIDKALEQFK